MATVSKTKDSEHRTTYDQVEHDDVNNDNIDINGNDNERLRLRYLIVKPEKGGVRDLWKYVRGDKASGLKFLESSDFDDDDDDNDDEHPREEVVDKRWVIVVSIVLRKALGFLRKPMEYTGFLVDFFLNLLSLNGDLLGLLFNFLRGRVVIPEMGTETFVSTIGHLDGRIDLYKGEDLLGQLTGYDASASSESGSLKFEIGNRALMDLCMMASKLAYENAKVVQNIVVHHWKMHFVEFYDCWNDFQKRSSTQVFIICDKPKDASLILISFRGTEPFDADDWCTDFDFSWYEIPRVGKVHMGFIEALGLGNRAQAATFQNLLFKNTNFIQSDVDQITSSTSLGNGSLSKDSDSRKGESEWTPPDMVKRSAYYTVRRKLESLLHEHQNAKFIVTGHSLGGALAILFSTVLVVHEETEMMQRLLGVYTFGQPRVGNGQLGRFMDAQLNHQVPRFFRVVYCNDIVPRLPYDDKTFLYKHFGVCLYYDSCYIEQKMDEEPDRNFFQLRYMIPMHMNALWELIRSLTMGYTYGPDYKEGWFSILSRIIGLALPGIAAHCPTDYVNSVRLGREPPVHMSSL